MQSERTPTHARLFFGEAGIRGTARASLQRKFPVFTVSAPDLVAAAIPAIEGDELGQNIAMPPTEFLKLKPGTVVLVSGKIWFATAPIRCICVIAAPEL